MAHGKTAFDAQLVKGLESQLELNKDFTSVVSLMKGVYSRTDAIAKL